ncbi:MAG: prepilin-type N-terminal cleavage/methylation domain-containing protein [Candidatus Buchananbacteria bacterium]
MAIYNKKGFTIIEILIAIAIFSILSSVMLVNFRKDQHYRDLKLDASLLEDAIKKTQTLALSGQSIDGKSFEKFVIKSNALNNGEPIFVLGALGYDGSMVEIEELPLKNSIIKNISNLKIEFDTPRGQARIFINNDATSVRTTTVKIQNISNEALAKCVDISSISGRVDVVNCE